MRIRKITQITPLNGEVVDSLEGTAIDKAPSQRAVNDAITGLMDYFPIGGITSFSGSAIPEGWLLCDGRAVSRTGYSELFAVIGTLYGVGDESTTFNLPNYQGRTTIGTGSIEGQSFTLGDVGGETTHQLTVNEIPPHSHTVSVVAGSGASSGEWGPDSVSSDTNNTITVSTIGGGQAHNNMQPYVAQNIIIKAKRVSTIEKVEVPKEIYDDQERVIGTWFGKPLYRKTYVVTTPSSLSTITNVGELPSGYEIIYIKDAFIIGTDAVEKLNVPDSTATKVWLRLSNNSSNPNKIALSIGANHLLNRTGYITLEYTKTTDQGGNE